MITPITGALSNIFSARSSAKSISFELSIDGIPFFGGPLENISLKSTDFF